MAAPRLARLARLALGLALPAALSGCVARLTSAGLVLPDADPVLLREAGGKTWELVLAGESAPVAYLDDCVVWVEGTRDGRRLIVRDWRVLDAGDGTGGFVGVLEAYGGRVRLLDRNTGTTLIIDDAVAGQLRAYVGKPVLVLGYITGGGIVAPIAWRLLAE